jgi:hypothetical protein
LSSKQKRKAAGEKKAITIPSAVSAANAQKLALGSLPSSAEAAWDAVC